jgi:hypothetical protein
VLTNIPGAPILGQPQYLQGTKNEIRTEKHGLVYPAFFDWNRDGKKDLMLGEFETGDTGSNIKVYLNEGTDKNPQYTGEYFYATDVNGDTITNHQWCCIGIHPRLIDMDGDGHLDLLSGQYNPGLISMWRGSEKGFQPREFIPQEGYVEGQRLSNTKEPWNPEANFYWNYTSADFADFNDDGLLDLFVGGSDGLRVALNIGTKEKPAFGLRKYLHHVDGDLLYIKKPTAEEIEKAKENDTYLNMSGVLKSYITPIDWDKDGVLDLLVTNGYYHHGMNPIEFFRGVNTDKGLRFELAKPLINAACGDKALPGCQPMITVVDYNNDGVKDIVMGISIPTVNGYEAAPEIAEKWINDVGIQMPGKDGGRNIANEAALKKQIAEFEKKPFLKKWYLGKLDDYKYLTLRHRGYVFVFEGQKNRKNAKAKKVEAEPAIAREVYPNAQSTESKLDGPVTYLITFPERVRFDEEMELVVDFKIKGDYYLYTEDKANVDMGFIPTVVDVEFESDQIKKIQDIIKPEGHPKGGMVVYKGDNVRFIQKFKLNSPTREDYLNPDYKRLEEAKVKVKIKFQTCNPTMCLPPETITETIVADIK